MVVRRVRDLKLIRNQQVVGSNPTGGSNKIKDLRDEGILMTCC
jgi:hypothetical protein